METKKKIAILGGSFDPPTIAHVQIVAEVYNNCDYIDEVWMIPCGDNRGDKKLKSNGMHRIEMVKLILNDIIDNDVPIKVNDIEVKEGNYLPTWNLLELLKKKYPKYEFYFIMGSDLVSSFRNWENGERLAKEVSFIILKRPGYNFDLSFIPDNSKILETNFEGSSTVIRNRLINYLERNNKINLGINGLTTNSVIKYIIENKLYQINI